MKKGFVLFDTIASIVCIFLLTLPILTTFHIMAQDTASYKEDKKLFSLVENIEHSMKIAKTPEDIPPYLESENYKIFTNYTDINEHIKKYTVEIFKEKDVKIKFFFYKIFDS